MSQSGRVRPARRRALAVAAVLVGTVFVLGGCSAEARDLYGGFALPEPATKQAPLIGDLWVGSWIAALGVGILVWGLIIWAVIAYRRRDDELPKQTRFNLPIEVLYTVAPMALLLALFYHTAQNQDEILDLSAEPDLTINVIGQQWSWTFNYTDEDVYDVGTVTESPTLYLPVDQTVRFVLDSPDVIHSFWIPSFYMKLDVVPGHTNTFQVTPDREGSYVGKCAELCGAYHSSMVFDVQVVPESEYLDHMESLRDEGNTGRIEAPLRGAYSQTPLNQAGSEE